MGDTGHLPRRLVTAGWAGADSLLQGTFEAIFQNGVRITRTTSWCV